MQIRQPLSGIHEVIHTLGWEVYQMILRTGGDVTLVYFSFLALRKMHTSADEHSYIKPGVKPLLQRIWLILDSTRPSEISE